MITEKRLFQNMFYVQDLQNLQNELGEETGMTLFMVGRDGQILTKPTNWNGYCRLFHGSYFCAHMCDRTISTLVEACRCTENPVEYICPHSGLTMAAIPMVYKGDFLGAMLITQIRLRKAEDDLLAGSANLFGVTLRDIRDIQYELPPLTMAEYASVLRYLRSNINEYLKEYFSLPMHA